MTSDFFSPTQQLLCKDGSTVLASHALGKASYVLLYFAASWCEPCCEFAPLLKSFYEKHHSEKAFEVVLLSFDNSEETMMDYFVNSNGNYYCLPYADAHATRTEWTEQCDVKGLPSIVVFRNESPRVVVTRYGCDIMVSDPNGVSFPWPAADPMLFEQPNGLPEASVAVNIPTVGDDKERPTFFDDPAQMLLRRDGSSVPAVEALRDAAYVLVYASAHWCSHCCQFTPLLKSFYEAHHVEKKFEVVFMSFDVSAQEMMDYFKEAHGDYYCLPFDDARAMRAEWKSLYNFNTIPTLLVFVNGYPRVLLTPNGRRMVVEDPDAERFPWTDAGAMMKASDTDALPWPAGGRAPRWRLELCLFAIWLLFSLYLLARMAPS